MAATIDGGPRDWENPCVVGINKRRAHVPLRSFPSAAEAFRHYELPASTPTAPTASPRVLSLNGRAWRFKLHGAPEEVPQAFSQPDFVEDGGWAEVRPAGEGVRTRGWGTPR